MNSSPIRCFFILYVTCTLINSECIDLDFKLTHLDTKDQKCDQTSYDTGHEGKCDMWYRAHVEGNNMSDVLFYNGNNADTLKTDGNDNRGTSNNNLKFSFGEDRKDVVVVVQFADEGTKELNNSHIRQIFKTFEIEKNLTHLNKDKLLKKEIRLIWQNKIAIKTEGTHKYENNALILPNKTIYPNPNDVELTYGYEVNVKNNCPTIVTTLSTATSNASTTGIRNITDTLATQNNNSTSPQTAINMSNFSSNYNSTANAIDQPEKHHQDSDPKFPTALLVVLIMFILLGVGLVLAIVWHDKLYDTVVPFLISANPIN